jgi:hypothetical protein
MMGVYLLDQLDPTQVAARLILVVAEGLGMDIRSLSRDWIFRAEQRMVYFWQEGGEWHYTFFGTIKTAPTSFQANPSTTDPWWSESGTIGGIEAAIALLTAWLVDGKEIDELPKRETATYGTN